MINLVERGQRINLKPGETIEDRCYNIRQTDTF